MPRKFYVTNKPGCDLVNAIENPDYDHSNIMEVDSDGTVIGNLPFLSNTEHMYKPEPDPRYSKPQVVVTAEGEIEIPMLVPEDKVATGENPFIQLIYRYVKKMGNTTEEDIIRHMLQEKAFLPADEHGIKRVKAYVKVMHAGTLSGLLIRQKEGYAVGLKLETGRHLIDIKIGFDPFEYQIMLKAENEGIVSRDELHRLFIDRFKWARSTKTVEHYIKKLLNQKNLRHINENFFEYKHPLELLKQEKKK